MSKSPSTEENNKVEAEDAINNTSDSHQEVKITGQRYIVTDRAGRGKAGKIYVKGSVIRLPEELTVEREEVDTRDLVELTPSFTEGLYSDKKRNIVDSFLAAIGLRSYK